MSIDDIKLVGVMGGGVMGGGIAQTFAAHGFKTIIRDLNDDLIEKTRASMVEGRFGLNGSVERGKMTQAEYDATIARFSFTQDVGDLRDCDLIVEAVPENLDLKKSVFTELDATVKKERDLRDEHVRLRDRRPEQGGVAPRPVHRLPLVQPGVHHEARRDHLRARDVGGDDRDDGGGRQAARQGDDPREGRARQVRLRREPHLLRDGGGGAQGAGRRHRQRARTSTR